MKKTTHLKTRIITKAFSLGLFTTLFSIHARAQTIIFSEDMGRNAVGNPPVHAYNGYQNQGAVGFSGTASLRTTSPSTGYANASGDNNVFLSGSGSNFTIHNIPIDGAPNISVAFGVRKNVTTEDGSGLLVEAIVDNGNAVALPVTLSTGSGTSSWAWITPVAAIPAGNLLTLKFTKVTDGSLQFRIDDVTVTSSTTLPVAISSFHGTSTNMGMQLDWSTAMEKNASHFEIQRSSNGTDFQRIATVAALNNETGADYHFTDNTLLKGALYYRLKAVDIDGTGQYSNILFVNNGKTAGSITLLASVVQNMLPLVLKQTDKVTDLRIADMAGHTIRKETIQKSGDGIIQLDISGLTSGMYLLQAGSGSAMETFKFVKQ